MALKVLVCDPIPSEAVEKLKKAGLEVACPAKLTPQELLEQIPAYQGVIVRSASRITREVIAQGTSLRVIGRAGVGLDNVDAAAAKERRIAVVNTPLATSVAVAELAIGMMFALSRKLPTAHELTRQGKWEKKSLEGTEITGKLLGLIGLGNIAKEVARRARALGMTVIAHRKDPKKYDPEAHALGVEMVALDELLSRSDIISLHTPLTPDTKNLIGAPQLARMKKGAFLIQCARGGVVDEAALAAALESGHLGGAAVDVFEAEPVRADNPLLAAPRVILTPHIGASSAEGQLRAGLQIADLVIQKLREPS